MFRAGLIVNPLAGVGGPKALRGSDGPLAADAISKGATMLAADRAREAIRSLIDAYSERQTDPPQVLVCGGPMGEDVLTDSGCEAFRVVYLPDSPTTPQDTVESARIMKEQGADLILFAGGDGTARDVVKGVGPEFPVLGIPAGVKMYTGIFLYRPAQLGRAVMEMEINGLRTSQVNLLDFERQDKNEPSGLAKFGTVTVPLLDWVQTGKSESSSEEDELEGIGTYMREHLSADSYYVIGTGRTVKSILQGLGYDTPVLGVDLLQGDILKGRDLTDTELAGLLTGVDRNRIFFIVTPLGGNGFILGRGNQQISPLLLKGCPRENVIVVSTTSKVNKLGRLRVDTGDNSLDERLRGLTEVITGYGRRRVCVID